MLQGLSYVGQSLDWAYTYIRSISLSEQSFIKNAKKHSLTLGEFRVLFATHQADYHLRPADAEDILLMPKATLSDILRSLERKSLVCCTALDGRSKRIRLTDEGHERTRRSAQQLDEMLTKDVRHAPAAERLQYVRSASLIVERERKRTAEHSA